MTVFLRIVILFAAMLAAPAKSVDVRAELGDMLLASIVRQNTVDVRAELSRDSIFLEETAVLTLSVENAGEAADGPDLAPLAQDFNILNQSVQMHVSIRDNERIFTQVWTMEILPKRIGKLIIPSIFVSGGSSAPITVEVLEFNSPASALGEDVHLEVVADRQDPYVQSQVEVRIRLFSGERLLSGDLTELRANNAVVMRVGKDRNYRVRRGERDYQVVERQYAVFPELSGDLTLSEVRFSGTIMILDQDSEKRVLHKQVTSEPVELQVQPKPQNYSGTTWLPVKDLKLTDSWSTAPKFVAGRPESRKIAIQADGARAIQIPGISYEQNDTLRIYGSQPTLNTFERKERIIGELTEEIVIVPQQVDTLKIPSFNVVWWDIDEDREKVATLPGSTVSLQSAAANDSSVQEPADSSPPEAVVANGEALPEEGSIWKTISLVLAVAWAATLYFWLAGRLRGRQYPFKPSSGNESAPAESHSRGAVRRACKDGDAAAAAQRLLAWGRMTWPQRSPASLIEIAELVPSEALRAELRKLDRSLYAQNPDVWTGDQLWEEFSRLRISSAHASKGGGDRNAHARRKKLAPLWQKSEPSAL